MGAAAGTVLRLQNQPMAGSNWTRLGLVGRADSKPGRKKAQALGEGDSNAAGAKQGAASVCGGWETPGLGCQEASRRREPQQVAAG